MRDFSIIRRRRNFVDLLTPKRVGVKGYRIQGSATFDGPYTTLMTADISSGYLDPSINSAVIHSISNRDQVRIVFNPDTFSGEGINDSLHFWLRFVPVDFSGSAGTPGDPHLVLTDVEKSSNSRVQIAGEAPQAVDVTASLVLELPMASQDFYIKNEDPTGSGSDLYVATMVGGAEQQIGPQQVYKAFEGTVSTLLVRGNGGAATFSASFASYLPL